MKKQFQILAATFITVAFISCSKEKFEKSDTIINEEISAKAPGGGGSALVNLNKSLIGRYEFNNTLNDTTGQLPSGISTVNRVLYTSDRKGVANRALLFNEGYGVDIFGVPLGSDMSLSVWIRTDIYPTDYFIPFVTASKSFTFAQLENIFQGSYWNGINGQYVASGPMDHEWHHLAATRDNNVFKFYIDGNLIGTSPTPAGSGPYSPTSDYNLGYGFNGGYKYWKGGMDDLRIYKRVLSANEITALFNL